MERTLGQVRASRDISGRAKRQRVGIAGLLFVPLLLSSLLLGACSSGSSGKDSGGKADALAFAKCMRENGVEAFPDPGDDGGQMLPKDSGIDPEAPEFKKAEEACKDLSPQGENGPKDGKPADLAKAQLWAQCIRDNGVPEFPDPAIEGNAAVVDMTGVPNEEGDPLDSALETCEDKRPSGNLSMRSGGGGQ